jgi:O-methyltransferase
LRSGDRGLQRGSGALIAKAYSASGKDVLLFDTFEGVVKSSERDLHYFDGEHQAEINNVTDLLSNLGLSNVKIFQGVFPDNTSYFLDQPIAFAHIDVDVYETAKSSFESIEPLLVKGGIVVFDDYGFLSTGGVQEYVDELKIDYVVVHNLNGHAIMVKTK